MIGIGIECFWHVLTHPPNDEFLVSTSRFGRWHSLVQEKQSWLWRMLKLLSVSFFVVSWWVTSLCWGLIFSDWQHVQCCYTWNKLLICFCNRLIATARFVLYNTLKSVHCMLTVDYNFPAFTQTVTQVWRDIHGEFGWLYLSKEEKAWQAKYVRVLHKCWSDPSTWSRWATHP